MGNKLQGIAFNSSLSEKELLKALEISNIKNKNEISFEELTSDFLGNYTIGVYKSVKGIIVFSDENIMTDESLLSRLSKRKNFLNKGKSIGFYIYDTTSTYCYDLFVNGKQVTQHYISKQESDDFESDNFGIPEKIKSEPIDLTENIFNLISDIIGEPYESINLNSKCIIYDYSPEGYISLPISKIKAKEILKNNLKDLFESQDFKYIKSRSAFVKKTKENEFEFYLGNTLGEIDDRYGIDMNMYIGLGVKNKKIAKQFKEITGKDIGSFTNQVNLEIILLSNNEIWGNDFTFKKASDLDKLATEIKNNFHSKILPFFDKYSSYDNVINHYLNHNINRHKYSVLWLNYLKLGLFCSLKKEKNRLIGLFENKKDEIENYDKLMNMKNN
jgi:hypothetical protein